MTVESVEFIDDLNDGNPQGGARISQGAEHIRNIKKAITNTFTGIEGEVTVTQDELNTLAGMDQPIIDVIEAGDQALIAVEERVTKNESDIGQNKTDITQNTTDIDSAEAAIAALEARLEKVEKRSGNMLTMVEQPSNAGDFNYEPSNQRYLGTVRSGQSISLTVPDGMVFALNYFMVGEGSCELDSDDIRIDGINVSRYNIYNSKIEGGDIWPAENGALPIKVTQSLVLKCQQNDGTIHVHGIFVEAE